MFLAYYLTYMAFVVLAAGQYQALGTLKSAMVWFVLPLTAVTLAVMVRLATTEVARSGTGGGQIFE